MISTLRRDQLRGPSRFVWRETRGSNVWFLLPRLTMNEPQNLLRGWTLRGLCASPLSMSVKPAISPSHRSYPNHALAREIRLDIVLQPKRLS
jgi:hypothetical protein